MPTTRCQGKDNLSSPPQKSTTKTMSTTKNTSNKKEEEEANDDGGPNEGDLIIRDGFPALRVLPSTEADDDNNNDNNHRSTSFPSDRIATATTIFSETNIIHDLQYTVG
mmetsp:Transcript_10508/g.25055  ORF Transcript_10508/g.25055 Transcript_10508/m.25055 type:complete len:109 (+) Transcript_10508:63-389(+)